MRKANLGVALACTGLVTGLALPAAAAPATTYHGTWTSVDNCSGPADIEPGNWNVTIGQDDKAQVSVTIFYAQGALHAAWGGRPFTQNDPAKGDLFDVQSGELRLVLDEDGQLTYSIANVACSTGDGTVYKTVYLYGELDH
jgi:hypothetical protein